MTKSNKFQRVDVRAQQSANTVSDVQPSDSIHDDETKTLPVQPVLPNREGVAVEERKMSFEEYRRLGVPAQYRNFFFSGR